MKSKLLLMILIWISVCFSIAQTPQIAVVKPNGVTTIHTSWTSAYNSSTNDDFVYLPGALINATLTIDKRLHIFGAGISPDSSSATGRTIIGSSITIKSGASGGTIEGIEVNGHITIGETKKVTNYTIKRCKVDTTRTTNRNEQILTIKNY